MAPKSFPHVDSLDTQTRLYFAALLLAQVSRLPVSPTRGMTLSLMGDLRDAALILVPWPCSDWTLEVRAERTPIEDLQWRPYVGAGRFGELLDLLRKSLQLLPFDDKGNTVRVELWKQLSSAEASLFFERQLRKHQFDVAWAQDLLYAQRDCPHPLSIASWCYCCWAATRHGASIAQQQRAPDATLVREAIYAELQRRMSYLAAGKWANCAFPPPVAEPKNAIGKIFVSDLAPMGMEFWTVPASLEGLIKASND